MKKCIIMGAGEFHGFRNPFTAEYAIAADGGYDHLTPYSIKPDLLIGDFDSIQNYGDLGGIEILRFASEKDSSDLELSVAEAVKRGFDCFYIYGALGKRLDHTIAAIAVLVDIARQGLKGWLIGKDEVVTAVTDGALELDARDSGIVSVFAAGDKANGVYVRGLKYSLDNAVLECSGTHGLSNEFVGEKAVIEVKGGTLIVIVTTS